MLNRINCKIDSHITNKNHLNSRFGSTNQLRLQTIPRALIGSSVAKTAQARKRDCLLRCHGDRFRRRWRPWRCRERREKELRNRWERDASRPRTAAGTSPRLRVAPVRNVWAFTGSDRTRKGLRQGTSCSSRFSEPLRFLNSCCTRLLVSCQPDG